MYLKTALSIYLLLLASLCFATPIIIYDSGKTIDAKQYYAFKKPVATELDIPNYQNLKLKQFPVITTKLTVGKALLRKIKKLPRAICIIGDDTTSKRWLKTNKNKLIKLNALCFVVNVNSERQFNLLKKLAKNINMVAAVGDDFFNQLNIKHYPVLINQGRVNQ